MSQRYEITPGGGLVARHGDSVLWAGSDLTSEAWDALGAVLDVIPGTDPSGSETAASLESLAVVLRAHPATTFAALVIADGHAQGIMRGPVTVCNATAAAPATGYEQFGVTVPFELSEAVYVGTVEAFGNSPSIAQLLDLDAGVVPGGGAWVHPRTSAHRYHTAAERPIDGPPNSTDADAGAVLPVASNDPEATQIDATDDHEDASEAAPVVAPPTDQQPASRDQQPSGVPSNDLPSLSAAPSAWAMPNVAAGNETAAGAFIPAEDHLRIDLRTVTPDASAQPLPLIPTSAPATQSAAHRSSVLVFDDGSTFALDQDYVIGRRPERHELVQSGQARPLTVVDPDTVLSGAHAALRLHGHDVYLEDLGSLNGSHVARPGATDWTRVEPFAPQRLEPGTRLLFGWTVATYSGSGDQA